MTAQMKQLTEHSFIDSNGMVYIDPAAPKVIPSARPIPLWKTALEVGRQMRVAQIQYFKTRTKEALVESKRLEREFDRLCANALTKAMQP
jgi:hypothetical protein